MDTLMETDAAPPARRWPASALSRIDRGLRVLLLKCRVPVGKVEAIETEIVDTFNADADSVYVMTEPCAFNRALVHVCKAISMCSCAFTHTPSACAHPCTCIHTLMHVDVCAPALAHQHALSHADVSYERRHTHIHTTSLFAVQYHRGLNP